LNTFTDSSDTRQRMAGETSALFDIPVG